MKFVNNILDNGSRLNITIAKVEKVIDNKWDNLILEHLQHKSNGRIRHNPLLNQPRKHIHCNNKKV